MEYLTESYKKRYRDITPRQRSWFSLKRKIAAKLHKLAYVLGLVVYPVNVVTYTKANQKYPGSMEYWSVNYSDPDNFGLRSYKTLFNRKEAYRFVIEQSKRPLLYRLRRYIE